jgi:hypothetical protein
MWRQLSPSLQGRVSKAAYLHPLGDNVEFLLRDFLRLNPDGYIPEKRDESLDLFLKAYMQAARIKGSLPVFLSRPAQKSKNRSARA